MLLDWPVMEVLAVVIQLSPSYVNRIGGVMVGVLKPNTIRLAFVAHSIKGKGQRRVGSESE